MRFLIFKNWDGTEFAIKIDSINEIEIEHNGEDTNVKMNGKFFIIHENVSVTDIINALKGVKGNILLDDFIELVIESKDIKEESDVLEFEFWLKDTKWKFV